MHAIEITGGELDDSQVMSLVIIVSDSRTRHKNKILF